MVVPAELRQLADRVAPVTLARDHALPVAEPLRPLFPDAGLTRGSVVGVTGTSGATSLALAATAGGVAGRVVDGGGRPARVGSGRGRRDRGGARPAGHGDAASARPGVVGAGAGRAGGCGRRGGRRRAAVVAIGGHPPSGRPGPGTGDGGGARRARRHPPRLRRVGRRSHPARRRRPVGGPGRRSRAPPAPAHRGHRRRSGPLGPSAPGRAVVARRRWRRGRAPAPGSNGRTVRVATTTSRRCGPGWRAPSGSCDRCRIRRRDRGAHPGGVVPRLAGGGRRCPTRRARRGGAGQPGGGRHPGGAARRGRHRAASP